MRLGQTGGQCSRPVLMASVIACMAVVADPGWAQERFQSLERRITPDGLPELREPEFAPPPPPFELPPLPPVPERQLGRGPSVLINRIDIVGNTAIPTAELQAIAAPYQGRQVTVEELFRLRDELTLAYVDKGYVNSGAVLPDQEVVDGVVRFDIVEGALEAVDIAGNRSFRPGYLEGRIRLGADQPLNVQRLQERLQVLLLDPMVRRLDARLEPGSEPGRAKLRVDVEEDRRLDVFLRAANDESPSIGANHAELIATWRNLFGRSDPLELSVGVTEGLREAGFEYSVPLTARDLRFHIGGDISESDVIDDEVEDLDIESESRSIRVGLAMPVIETASNRVGLDLTFERERNKTFLLDEPFSFSPGADEGRTDLSLLRFTQDWQNRGRRRAISLASTFTLGLDILGATENDEEPDGQFLSWFGQGELAHRVFGDNDQVVLRGTVQLTEDPLLASEQFAIGGLGSVRGYRINEVVRDNGWTVSLEYRFPLLDYILPERPPSPDAQSVELVPFFDAGSGFNHHKNPEDSKQLASVGLGVRWRFPPRLLAELYWGVPVIDRDESSDDPLQDAGIGFRIGLDLY